MSGENFLGRWARRKAQHQRGVQPEAGPAAPEVPAATAADAADGPIPSAATAPSSSPAATGPGGAGGPGAAASDAAAKSGQRRDAPAEGSPSAPQSAARPEPLPSIESLTPDSDFRPFMQSGVEPQTRNAALRKLFSDPHFNQMDGLDIYIDDYGKPDPIPPAMLRALNQARTLRLFEKDETAERGCASSGGAAQTGAPAPAVAEPESQRPVALESDAGADLRADEPSTDEPSADRSEADRSEADRSEADQPAIDQPAAARAAAGHGTPVGAADETPACPPSGVPGASRA